VNRSILLAFAHPDDESFGLAGTIARYARRGVPVDLVTATRGEKGTRLGVPEGVATGVAREAELRAAGRIVGLRDIYFLGYIDGELDRADPAEVTRKIREIIEQVEPEVLITFGPDGITGHPDHIVAGKAATAAFRELSTAGRAPRKLYYVTVPGGAFPDGDAGDVFTRPDDEVTTEIDITGLVDLKLRALAAHRSQQDAADFIEMLKQSGDSPFTLHEYLYLASGPAPRKETDLFQ
jgi:LmbE family N-acetylglucosaminyl deacetylase